MNNFAYKVENFTADIPVADYMAGYRDAPHFMKLCQKCPNYGKSWGCPPFDFDTEAVLRQYNQAHIIATKITPEANDIPISESQKLMIPERIRLERELLDMEKSIPGSRAFAFVGKCLYCQKEECNRACNQPCRHPDKVRPSLEAFGFDISKTLTDLFGIKLLWSENGLVPPYLMLVTALFHNNDRTLSHPSVCGEDI